MLSARRVVARYLQADAIADPKAVLTTFSEGVEWFATKEADVKMLAGLLDEMKKAYERHESAPTYTREVLRKVADVEFHTKMGLSRLHRAGSLLFLAILQQYAVPPNKVKKVQAAAKYWSKTRWTAKKFNEPWAPSWASSVYTYLDLLSTFREQVAVATDVVSSAKLHGMEETPKMQAGPFTLVNTGNFKPEVMEHVQQVVEKAAKAMAAAGLGKVCYGDIMVSNTITSKSNVLAFYLLTSDEMFVRANVKPDVDTVRIVCHELAHRLQNKFLKAKDNQIRTMYQSIVHNVRFGPAPSSTDWPTLGKQVQYKGKDLVVLRVNKDQNVIEFGEPPARGTFQREVYKAPLEWWTKTFEGREPERGPDFKGFITSYAQKGGPDENFAEMVSFYVLGRLPQGLVDLLEPLIK